MAVKGKLVKVIDVFGKRYEVRAVKNLKDENNNLIDGLHDPDGFIYVCDKLKGREFFHTVIHELGHARDKRLSFEQTSIPEDVFELLCDTFATVMVEVFDVSWKSEK